jgi:hypothetical protein
MRASFLVAAVLAALATAGHLLTAQQGRNTDGKPITKSAGLPVNQIAALQVDFKPGDIFTPAIQRTIRQLLAPELKGEAGKDTKQILKDDAPKAVPLQVNTKYPEKAALPTVPSNLLLTLPHLPEELEYRIVGKHLILRDTGADLIVDFIPNAIR